MRSKRYAVLASLLLWTGAVQAGGVGSLGGAEGTCRDLPRLNVTFRFGTGSPPAAPPAVGPDGAIYVGTREGYLHALHSDGSYRWSYTVRGHISGRSVTVASGAVLVPTVSRIYSLRADGKLLWNFRSPVRVRGDLIRGEGDRVYFGSEDGRVFSLSSRGALFGHSAGKVWHSALPIGLADGAIATGRDDGSVVVSSKHRVTRFKLTAPVSALLGCPGARVCAIADGMLYALGMPKGESFRTPAVRAAQNGELLSVLASDERLEVFRGTRGERVFQVALPQPASASPVLDGRGTTYVPLRNGALLGVARDGSLTACVAVGSSPLGAPVLDAPRKRLLVTASEGLVASIELE